MAKNKMLNKENIILIAEVSMPILLAFYSFIYFHEMSHKAINNLFGLESEIKINLDFSGKTIIDITNLTEEDKNTFFLLHGLNEIIGYHTLSIVVFLFSFFFLALIYFSCSEIKEKEKKNCFKRERDCDEKIA